MPEQKQFQAAVESTGARYFVIKSVDDLQAVLDSALISASIRAR